MWVQVAKATARDWRRDRRRAPKSVLKQLRELAQIRAVIRRFPPPWSVEELDACYVVRDHDGQQLA
jgi:hypothetical protein